MTASQTSQGRGPKNAKNHPLDFLMKLCQFRSPTHLRRRAIGPGLVVTKRQGNAVEEAALIASFTGTAYIAQRLNVG